ncbi:MAG: zinc finger MYND domain-containing protein [Verrucomicrobia bacterium]|nr:zinc finger MYND domain-containing protein [Verrucomicrobiota bacterium]MBS0646973.1 zinc finger MYND domain-containing protein [Verrucomicrobiota bacterium]
MASLQIVPGCSNPTCQIFQADEVQARDKDSLAATVHKLKTCARCHFARYCSPECQKQHWKSSPNGHKTQCCESKQPAISPVEVDDIVAGYCDPRAGKAVLTLNPEKKPLKLEHLEAQGDKLVVSVTISEKVIGEVTYFLRPLGNFNWEQKLANITNPPNGIHNPGAYVTLAHDMIERGLYQEAFQMMATSVPSHYRQGLYDLFFSSAVQKMQAMEIDVDTIVACAQLIGKNRAEVDVVLHIPKEEPLPEDLLARIKGAEKLPYGNRDIQMEVLAREIMSLGLYDQAFDLIFNWVANPVVKSIFFRSAADVLVSKGVSYDKIVQLARKIDRTDHQILNELTGVYPKYERIEFACEMARLSSNPDYYLEIVFSSLLVIGKKEEAHRVLSRVSEAKQRDLLFYLHD